MNFWNSYEIRFFARIHLKEISFLLLALAVGALFFSSGFLLWVNFLLFSALLLFTLFLSFMIRSLPAMDGCKRVPYLKELVSIQRDGNGIPHISAQSEQDADFGLGYTHAQDRLWHMDFMRRFAQGRLAEVLGKDMIPLDIFMRKMGLSLDINAAWEALPKELKESLEAYAEGVNAYISESSKNKLPMEFRFLGSSPEPWSGVDCLFFPKLMMLQLSGIGRKQINRSLLKKYLPDDFFKAIFPEYTDDDEDILVLSYDDYNALEKLLKDMPPPFGFSRASNVWVLGAGQTNTNSPILANDPHLALSNPGSWYLARVLVRNEERVGATMPGMPIFLVGHNGHIAWGVSSSGAESQDLYLEKIDPRNQRNYLHDNQSVPFLLRNESVKIKGYGSLNINIYETNHGPIISDLDSASVPRKVISYALAGINQKSTALKNFYKINRSYNASNVLNELEDYAGPPLNFHFADKGGNISFISAGLIPIRGRGDGSYPVLGHDSAYDWIGYIPFMALPKIVNPANDAIFNSNNAVVDESYSYKITRFWAHPHRYHTVGRRVIQGNNNVENSIDLQLDSMSPALSQFVHILRRISPKTSSAINAKEKLLMWDGNMRRSSVEPLIFYKWLQKMAILLFKNSLDDKVSCISTENIFSFFLNYKNLSEDKVFIEQASQAFCKSVKGVAWPNKDWGAYHRANLKHIFWRRVPFLNWLFDLSIPTDGDGFTVNAGGMALCSPTPFLHVHGAVFRAVFDFSDLSKSKYIMATGVSGHPLSSFYGNMTEKWQRGEMIDVNASGPFKHKLELLPER